jgi:DNA polymerase I-like protein with 3'-5' exonuclease and polymerase domains
MVRCGVPLDAECLDDLQTHWDEIKESLVEESPEVREFYDGAKLKYAKLDEWIARHKLPWPRTISGRPATDKDTLKDLANRYPALVGPFREIKHSLSDMRLTKLVVGPDGRNRVHLFPFGAITGRNAPPASAFIFGPSTWLRGLIKPEPGRALAYLDYSSQEFFIMAALSRDPRMLEACQADDAYLAVAHVCGYVPRGATKHSHPAERAAFKTTTLALGYGMGPMTMARKLCIPVHQARAMPDTYKDRYHRFAK